jgi:protein-tyrosine phosphatase
VTTIQTFPLANLRDLGGIPVQGGRVRPGLVLRSDDVALVDEPGALALVASGVSLVIDLRSPGETTLTGRGVLAGHPVEYLHLPLTADVGDPAALVELFAGSTDPERTMGEWYAQLLEERADSVVQGLRAIADNPGGSLFHCAAGKDRTGIFAAALLTVLGADEADVVADYARTAAALEAIMARIAGRHPGAQAAEQWQQVPAALMGASPVTMARMLQAVRAAHGSMTDLLVTAGYDDELAARLRHRLVEPA